MSEIKSGVNIMCRFVKPDNALFGGYIKYIDRDEAVRNDNIEQFNSYMDYMGNPEKTSELYNADKDQLNKEDLEQLKKKFEQAQDNQSLMWQTVISFDNRWLEENGLYDTNNHTVDTVKLKELTRGSINKILKKENMNKSAEWSAAIHYNTDNIHIHVAIVEPIPMRQKVYTKDGKEERRGKWKYSSIAAGRSNIVNRVLNQSIENQMINDLIRNKIIGHKKETEIGSNKLFVDLFDEIYDGLPADRKKWNYNSLNNEMKNKIDLLSKQYINKYHVEDYNELQKLLKAQEDKYKKAYGDGNIIANQYAANKEADMFVRLGNIILKEMKQYDVDIKKENRNNQTRKNKFVAYRGKSLYSIQRAIEKDLAKTRENYVNMAAYERITREQQEHNSFE